MNSDASSVEQIVGRIANVLASTSAPAFTSYELAKHVFGLLEAPQDTVPKAVYQSVVQSLLRTHLLTQMEQITPKAYLLFGRSGASPAEVICSLDPFAYVSHLSAMEHHGLTDRFPKVLYLTRPSATEWRKQAEARTVKDLGDRLPAYLEAGLPQLVPPKIVRLGHTAIQFCERSQQGAFRLVAGSSLRVATIGRVFLDMLREPVLCGGIQHVIDIYRREAKRFLKLIIDEVDRHGQPIDKVRAGYLLSEVCKLDAPELASWQLLSQRGGSRKLDAEGEYAPIYSERWLLSINVPSLTMPEKNDD